ncbi:MAG: tRNA (N(6)-L-threonylcarbamoyladenosine(37)-C(2))-methylthiotransferase MtaB [Lachnospiraceae bacterium]|nr:tRNA (N(6)-L-threonylcarbamoyladenosine(37)-C(2))-methylthiotransferase MtaB [Lachnospiraceae bacterium]
MELENLKIAFHTLGCKVNIYESEVMMQEAQRAGAVLVPFTEKADVYVVNTCTVTNTADKKSRSYLRRVRKLNPDAVVAACGCFPETAGEEAVRETGADLIIGNRDKERFVRILSDYLNRGILPAEPADELKKPRLAGLSGHTRADVKVQDGCNQFCSYCIIPYARGRIRSRAVNDILEELEALTSCGVQEVVLTGIHLSSYGKDDPEAPDDALLRMIEAVHALPGVKRIRLGSLEPRIVTEEFAARLSALDKICPHFHLSLQSGCAETLKRMNRHYTPEEYRKSCEILRQYFDDPAITTDVIVGFPGETDEEFESSARFVEEIGFYELHVFRYSRRKGTVADRMKDQIPESVKQERSAVLIALGGRMSQAYRMRYEGKKAEVLTEQPGRLEGERVLFGYTKEYIRAAVPESCGENKVVRGKLLASSDPELMKLEV